MGDRGPLTKGLAVAGAVMVWLPLIAPLALSAVRFAEAGRLRIDYLMPAELFPVAITGGLVLLWAAMRARSHRALVAWSLGAAVASLALGMAIATITGLASAAAEPQGWRVLVVTALIAAYVAAVVVLAVAGVSLARTALGRRAG